MKPKKILKRRICKVTRMLLKQIELNIHFFTNLVRTTLLPITAQKNPKFCVQKYKKKFEPFSKPKISSPKKYSQNQ